MRRTIWSLLAGVAMLASCGKRDDGAREAPATPAPSVAERAAPGSATQGGTTSAAGEARSIFASRCAGCHGATGKGDGPTAGSLQPAPRDYTDAAWQRTVTDEDLTRVILEGGGALGRSPMMPPAPDLREKPAVVAELVAMIRGFAPR